MKTTTIVTMYIIYNVTMYVMHIHVVLCVLV